MFSPDITDGESYTKPTRELSDSELLNEAANLLDSSENEVFDHVCKKTGVVADYGKCFEVSGDFKLPILMRQWMRENLDSLRA